MLMQRPSTAEATVGAAPAARPDPFSTAHLMADLKGRSVRGGAITLILQGFKFAFQLGSTVILARLLTPADFGLVAMVTAVTGFVAMFKDLGLSQATVQRQHITHAQVSTLFWINVALSVVLMLIVMGLSPLIAWFYGEPRLTPITLALAATFIFGGLTVQHGALLIRQMRFATASTIDVTSMAAGVLAAVLIAYQTHSYWSLVALPAAQSATHCLLTLAASRWVPGLPRRGSGVRSMLRFGGYVQGVNLTYFASTTVDGVILGRLAGATALGYYGRALQLLSMPFSLITMSMTRLVIPTLSRLKNKPAPYQRYFRAALELVAIATFPIVACIASFAPEIVALALGPGWDEVAVLFRLLTPAALALVVLVVPGWVCISTGSVHRQFIWCIVGLPFFIVAFLAGAWLNGAVGIAIAYSVCNLLFLIAGIFYCLRGAPVGPSDVAASLARPFAAASCAGAITLAIMTSLPTAGIFRLLPGSLLLLAVYLGISMCLPGFRQLMLKVTSAIRNPGSVVSAT